MSTASEAPRRLGVRLIAVLVTALGINALVQVPHFLPGWGNDPWLLSAEQLVVGIVGVAAGFATWRHRPSAWILTVAWGVSTALLVLSLPSLLALDADESGGIRYGSLVIIALTAWFGWYLRRVLTDPAGTPTDRT